ncbi:hypothetical protein GK047_13715 [Paenibacillus sp. SYP-B3998]|uniref:Uncharacterized protein n=1 Tax=Paenibacillus sp. SYP-B3998 TaxID=2678564 RepID=A0A6G3ZZE3_9BACL|nr:hypothetical protein [Paenibacillus sp. SYP-B3998]NEW07064.1 hypothetical protein [Paenibacillus sp. SYP-B3998]
MNALRWVLFVPAIVVVKYLLIGTNELFFQLLVGMPSNHDLSIGATVYKCFFSAFCTFTYLTTSCFIAPKARERISIIYFVATNSLIGIMFLNFRFYNSDIWLNATPILFGSIGALLSLIVIKITQKKRIFDISRTANCFIIYSTVSLLVFCMTLKLNLIPPDTTIASVLGIFSGLLVTIVYLASSVIIRKFQHAAQV